jgi:hypothetical protein
MNLLRNLVRATILFSLGPALSVLYLEAAEKAQQVVQVSIGTVLASNETDNFDPKLSKLKRQLEVIKYRSYHLIREDSQKLDWQSSATFDIPGGRSLIVTPEEYRNDRLSLKVRLLEGEKPLLDTRVSLRNRGNFLLGGPPHEGGVLILSISAMTQ